MISFNFHRQRRSPKRYTSYMDLMTKIVETEPSSSEEAYEKLVWVDAIMVEELYILTPYRNYLHMNSKNIK